MLSKSAIVEDLSKDVGSVVLSGHVDHVDLPSSVELPHLEDLALDVTRVPANGGAVAQVH